MKKILCLALCLLLCSVLCTPAIAAPAYTAGTYTATVDGHNGKLTVEVTFTDSAIESVAVTEHAETAGIADSALNNVPAAIVVEQSLNVDTISGATVTSKAIIAGVTACVEQAGANPADLQTDIAAEYRKNLTAGTYTAAKHGHHSDVVVETVVTNDTIQSVTIVSEGESYNIADLVFETIPDAIVANQSIGLDAVTGATYTTRAVLSAVESCLMQAGGQEAVLAFSKKIPAESWSTEEIEEIYDVVVVGSGLSGMVAAMAAQDEGAKVALLEKLPYWGGISQTTFGSMVYTDGDKSDDIYNYLMQRYIGYRQGDTYMGGDYPHVPSVTRIAEESNETIRWLEESGAKLRHKPRTGKYYGEVQEDGSVIHRLADYAQATFDEGDAVAPDNAGMGMKRLLDHFTSNGGVLYLNTAAESLITDENGTVVGVKATGKGGKYTFNAKGVVLCAGGFGASEEMIAEIAPAYIGERNITLPSNTGDGIRMAMEIGAAIYEDQFMMGGAGHALLSDADMISEYKDCITPKSAVYVNPNGMRVNSEDPESYSNSTLHVNPDSRDYYWIIINEEVAAASEIDSNLYNPPREIGSYKDLLESELIAGNENFYKADTLGELAREIKIVPSTLMYTMNRYNKLCEKGEDTDLFKPAQYLTAMEEGPFYAAKAYMSYFGTIGGVVTDENAAVLKEDGNVIPGLYAAGENSNHNVFNNCYTGGFALGECVFFGRIAGRNAAQAALK